MRKGVLEWNYNKYSLIEQNGNVYLYNYYPSGTTEEQAPGHSFGCYWYVAIDSYPTIDVYDTIKYFVYDDINIENGKVIEEELNKYVAKLAKEANAS